MEHWKKLAFFTQADFESEMCWLLWFLTRMTKEQIDFKELFGQ